MNSERYWLVEVGPFDRDGALAWAAEAAKRNREHSEIELIDDRDWYARAWDADSVRTSLTVLRAGLAAAGVHDSRLDVMSLVEDMETWLERDLDPRWK